MKRYFLAIDIGASSGRHIVGWREAGEIKTKVIVGDVLLAEGVETALDSLIPEKNQKALDSYT